MQARMRGGGRHLDRDCLTARKALLPIANLSLEIQRLFRPVTRDSGFQISLKDASL